MSHASSQAHILFCVAAWIIHIQKMAYYIYLPSFLSIANCTLDWGKFYHAGTSTSHGILSAEDMEERKLEMKHIWAARLEVLLAVGIQRRKRVATVTLHTGHVALVRGWPLGNELLRME